MNGYEKRIKTLFTWLVNKEIANVMMEDCNWKNSGKFRELEALRDKLPNLIIKFDFD